MKYGLILGNMCPVGMEFDIVGKSLVTFAWGFIIFVLLMSFCWTINNIRVSRNWYQESKEHNYQYVESAKNSYIESIGFLFIDFYFLIALIFVSLEIVIPCVLLE